MTLGTFRDMLAGYMGREPSVFIVNNVNLLERATNQARKWAERQHRFECAREPVVVRSVSLADGGLLSGAVRVTDNVSISVRTIERAYLPFTDNSGQFEIRVVTRDADMREKSRAFEHAQTTDQTVLGTGSSSGTFRLVRNNERIYLSPFDQTTVQTTRDVYMDVVKWMPDYIGNEDNDWFLEHCEDFMLMRAVYQLNFMLKEDQRVAISEKTMAEVWETVLKVDNDAVIGSSDDADLE